MITGIQGASGPGPRIASRSRGGFRLAENPSGVAAIAPAVTPALLSLQEVATPEIEALARGFDIVDALAAAQRALLTGGPGSLERLAALLDGPAAADPGLREVVSALELRARVLLALAGRETPMRG